MNLQVMVCRAPLPFNSEPPRRGLRGSVAPWLITAARVPTLAANRLTAEERAALLTDGFYELSMTDFGFGGWGFRVSGLVL